jgi:hypothetical protein
MGRVRVKKSIGFRRNPFAVLYIFETEVDLGLGCLRRPGGIGHDCCSVPAYVTRHNR